MSFGLDPDLAADFAHFGGDVGAAGRFGFDLGPGGALAALEVGAAGPGVPPIGGAPGLPAPQTPAGAGAIPAYGLIGAPTRTGVVTWRDLLLVALGVLGGLAAAKRIRR